MSEMERAREALFSISADIPRDEWVKVGMAAHSAGLSYEDYENWSSTAPSFNAQACRAAWRSFKRDKGIGPGTLYAIAEQHGRHSDRKHLTRTKAMERPPEPRKPAAPMVDASEVWNRCEPASNAHPYIVQKGAEGAPLDDLRVLPATDPLRICGESMAGALVIPCRRPDRSISSLQFITLPDVTQRLKDAGKPGKLNLPGAPLEGWHSVGEFVPGGTVYIVEGIGTAWACWIATGAAAAVTFGAGNTAKVAHALRQQDATARLVIVPDVGKETKAHEVATEVRAAVAALPEGWPSNSDACDYAESEGTEALELLLAAASDPPPLPLPLSVAFADELPDAFTPADELVQGVLTAADSTVLYGDSNSGKTFFVIDMAAAVARGIPWMGRETEQGLVLYLAAESPASVRSRLQAYQKHHGVKVPNFAIVQSPIDLFDGEADADKVIQLVRQLEAQRGRKVRLIVGDTLARLSAGANENAGQDMGLVVKRFDRIRTECCAHFLLIHHSGKAAAAGARGWSGIRAAVDTEIEVTDANGVRCAEITKQRDLSTKGERIGFTLEPVTLGLTKWGAPATSCVVVPADAPEKAKGKRMGEVEGAVLEFLAAHKVGIKKIEVVKHFDGRYEKGPIYRAMKALVTANALHEAAGMVAIAGAAK